MTTLPAEFLSRMRAELGDNFGAFLKSYDSPAEKGLRVNTLKISAENFKSISPFSLESVPWEKNGFYVRSEGLGKTVYHAAGLYYVQEPSAMCAAPELGVKAGERVLDLCSAPGGKGTQLAQEMRGEGIIVLNEINFRRAKILSFNVERFGIKNAVVTCAAPEQLADKLESYFDKILVDAPCSGEGMFKKEKEAIPEWSIENVKLCARRQSDILDSAFKMLSVGGKMVYSTCTFAPEEDEEQIRNFIGKYPMKLLAMKKLYPHEIRGEGHFYAVLQKDEGAGRDVRCIEPNLKDKKLLLIYRQWEKENLKTEFGNLYSVGQVLYSLPDGAPQTEAQTLRAGVRLGEFLSDRFEPSHSLALALKAEEAYCVDVDEKTAEEYLRGFTFCCENVKGWRLVTFKGYPLGWCKVSGGTAKNKLPKGVRI